MKVLIACEYSGTVRDAFTKKGHEAISCDIIPTESPGKHIQDDVLNHLYKDWDLIIAHPPCTYLSNAGARHLYPKGKLNQSRYKKGLEAKKFFMCFYNLDCKVAIENPIPSTVFELPKYNQVVQPYEYGHPFQKKTCLWLKDLPKLKPTKIVFERESTKIPGNWYNKGGKERQKNRAKFFSGIAEAMADQWGSL
tara:strand:+ start:78 stop:659 length:582 start_codon:yes stop_codon:yes gene_type:complete